MTAAAFSGDGTVMAVAAENVITLWNPDKNILLSVLGSTLTVKPMKLSLKKLEPFSIKTNV